MPFPAKPLKPEAGPVEWFGAELRHHRIKLGLTQDGLGQKVYTSGATIGKIEKAQRRCSLELAEALDAALATGGVLARAWVLTVPQPDKRCAEADKDLPSSRSSADSDRITLTTEASGTPGASMQRRTFAAALGATVLSAAVPLVQRIDDVSTACLDMARHQSVGASDVARLHAVHDLYQSLDHQFGGGAVKESLERVTQAASTLLNRTHSEHVRRPLFTAVAKLRLLAGWTAFDMCDHYTGQRHFAAAERLALSVGDFNLVAFVRYRQARQLQHLQHNLDAAEVLRHALEDLQPEPAVRGTRAMLHATLATSLAAIGSGDAACAMLDLASDEFDGFSFESAPEWLGWRSRGELYAQYGRVYRDLARSDSRFGQQAVEWTSRAIDGFDDGMQRSSLLNQTGLASAYFLAGEPTMALGVAERILTARDSVTSGRIGDRIANLHRDAVHWKGTPEVTEFLRQVDSLPTRAAR
ncbi:helix-turn-helix protein [Stackebrandtia albiflava]|uniref:Helix-turn-helix protein n=1 Tax=Stackebrandtia albiflava TaxID=406432 RepID=A0A562UQ21_9ACTN|nr:helix-turn-helix transcriptional regulator [Stackebrandtia albiflava]TWJ07709.1 helix-turn-helix protein [Stackebrandtia albiflava]